jgi:hypothetical protein
LSRNFGLYDSDETRAGLCRQTPDTRLVIIDLIAAYLGKTNSHKNAEVLAALAPRAALAREHDLQVT